MNDKSQVIRDTDADAIRLAKTLLRTSRYGALAVLDPDTGGPLASRVGVATSLDGTPIILISMLSAHTPAILADPRCSLLLGEAGKGDPLAHPRISLICVAKKLEKGSNAELAARRRYLNRNPKAELYADLGDFSFFGLSIERASLNGGFGRAYILTRPDLVGTVEGLAEAEQGAVDHMNGDHSDAINLYAKHFAKLDKQGWRMTGIDSDGFDLVNGEQIGRIWFDQPLNKASELRHVLVAMAKSARAAYS